MNSRILIGLTSLVLGAAALNAQADDRYRDDSYGREPDRGYARVLSVEPIVESVRYTVPVERCWDEQQAYRENRAPAALIGGVLGAAIGSHVGHGVDRPVTTIGGAIAGALLGNRIDRDGRDRDVRYTTVRSCETRQQEHWEQQVVAYRVNYVYRGYVDEVRLAYDPGRWLRLDDARRRG